MEGTGVGLYCAYEGTKVGRTVGAKVGTADGDGVDFPGK